MILGPDGAKLSKRHGAVSVLQYRDEGFLPEALLNYLVRLGWSHGDQEIFTIEDMIRLFDIARCEQVGLGLQSGEARLAQSAAHDARSAGAHRAGAALASGARRHSTRQMMRSSRQIVVAQRERAKTMKEMAAEQRVLSSARRRPTTKKPCAST